MEAKTGLTPCGHSVVEMLRDFDALWLRLGKVAVGNYQVTVKLVDVPEDQMKEVYEYCVTKGWWDSYKEFQAPRTFSLWLRLRDPVSLHVGFCDKGVPNPVLQKVLTWEAERTGVMVEQLIQRFSAPTSEPQKPERSCP